MSRKSAPDTFLRTYRDPINSGKRRARRIAACVGLAVFGLAYGYGFGLFAPAMLPVFAAPIALLFVIAIWALPEMEKGPVGLLEPLFFAFVFVTFVWPKYLAITLPGLPWITFSRLVGIPMALIMLISLSVNPKFRAELTHALNAAPIIPRLVVLFVAIQFASIAFSHDIGGSVQMFIIDQLNWTLPFFLGCYVFCKPKRAIWFSYSLWAISLLVGIIGIIERKKEQVLWADHIPSILRVQDPSVLLVLAGTNRNGDYRAISTFTTALSFAEFLQLSIPFVFFFVATSKRLSIRLAAIASAPLLLVATFASGSRSGVLGFGVASMLYFLLWAILRWRKIKAGLIAPAVVLAYPVLFSLAVSSTFLIGAIRHKVWGGGEDADSNMARTDQYAAGIPMVFNHPFGHGIGQGAEALGFRLPSGLLTIDTYYLLVALEYGIPGFLVYYGMMLSAVWTGVRYTVKYPPSVTEYWVAISGCIALVNFVITNSILSQTDNHSLPFIVLGLIVALTCRMKDDNAAAAKAQPSGSAADVKPARRPALVQQAG